MVAMSEARATHSSPLGKNQCVDQSSAALYIFQCGVFYKFKSASSTGVAQPQKCNLFTNRKIAKVYKSMIKVQGFAACFSEFCWVLLAKFAKFLPLPGNLTQCLPSAPLQPQGPASPRNWATSGRQDGTNGTNGTKYFGRCHYHIKNHHLYHIYKFRLS